MNDRKIFTHSWGPSEREDIRLATKAEELGFCLLTSYKFADGEQIPHDCLSFEKRNTRIWFCVYNGPHWVAADLDSDHYVSHRDYDHLIDALMTEN